MGLKYEPSSEPLHRDEDGNAIFVVVNYSDQHSTAHVRTPPFPLQFFSWFNLPFFWFKVMARSARL